MLSQSGLGRHDVRVEHQRLELLAAFLGAAQVGQNQTQFVAKFRTLLNRLRPRRMASSRGFTPVRRHNWASSFSPRT